MYVNRKDKHLWTFSYELQHCQQKIYIIDFVKVEFNVNFMFMLIPAK